MSTETTTPIVYIGAPGAGLGFQLSGVDIRETSSAEEAVTALRQLKSEGKAKIIFLDESLAAGNLDVLGRLNEDPLPAIILLPSATNPQNVAAKNLQKLMIRAIGSDIFS